jgi:hypothetical protein
MSVPSTLWDTEGRDPRKHFVTTVATVAQALCELGLTFRELHAQLPADG